MRILRIFLSLCLISPVWMKADKPKAGTYRGTLLLQEKNAVILPFNFTLSYNGT